MFQYKWIFTQYIPSTKEVVDKINNVLGTEYKNQIKVGSLPIGNLVLVLFLGALVWFIGYIRWFLLDRELWYLMVCIIWMASASGGTFVASNGNIFSGNLIELGMYDQNIIEGFAYAGLCICFSWVIIRSIEQVKLYKEAEKVKKSRLKKESDLELLKKNFENRYSEIMQQHLCYAFVIMVFVTIMGAFKMGHFQPGIWPPE